MILHGEQLGVHDNSITLLEENINVLENTDAAMQEYIDALEDADMITEERLDELEVAVNGTTPDELYERVNKLENITSFHQNEIDELVVSTIIHSNDIDELKYVDTEFEDRISQLEDGSGVDNTSSLAIGFHARLTSSSIPEDTPILYNNIMVNVGGRYSSDTGIFTANASGLFYFEQYFVTDYRYYNYLKIEKNGEIQCSSYADSGSDNEYEMHGSSCSAVVELDVGDQVYVTSSELALVYCAECAGFTGFLIKKYV